MYLSSYLFCPALLARSIAWATSEQLQNYRPRSSVVMPRTSFLTIVFCSSSPQGNSLWHPQWALQVWCHPGELNLCLLCRDNQGGSHPPGLLCSGWRWPARFAPARDSRTGPDVSNQGQGAGGGGADMEEDPKEPCWEKSKCPFLYCSADTSKREGRGKQEPKGMKRKPLVSDPFTAMTGACSYHTSLAELGSNLASTGSLSLPSPSQCNSTGREQWLCACVPLVGVSMCGGRTDPDPLTPLLSCEIPPALPSTPWRLISAVLGHQGQPEVRQIQTYCRWAPAIGTRATNVTSDPSWLAFGVTPWTARKSESPDFWTIWGWVLLSLRRIRVSKPFTVFTWAEGITRHLHDLGKK